MKGSDSITIAELDALCDHCTGALGVRDRTLVELVAATGLRVSEVACLRVGQVMGMGRAVEFLHLRKEETKRQRGGKLPLDERIRAMLEIYVTWLREWYEGEWLFPGYDDKHITSRAIQKVIKGLAKAAGKQAAVFRFVPVQSVYVASNDGPYVILPKRKLRGGFRMDLTLYGEFDIYSYAEAMSGWGRYAGLVGDSAQVKRIT